MLALGTIDFWTYALGMIFVILLLGSDSLFALVTSVQCGVTTGYRVAYSVFLGDAVPMLLLALGVASLLKAESTLFIGLKYLGTTYLFYLGVGMLRGAWRRLRNPGVTATQAEQMGVRQSFHKVLLLSLSDPETILFLISFFTQFADPGYAYPGLPFPVLAVILELVNALYLSFLIFTDMWLAAQSRRWQRLAAGVASDVGVLFVGFDVRLAAVTLS